MRPARCRAALRRHRSGSGCSIVSKPSCARDRHKLGKHVGRPRFVGIGDQPGIGPGLPHGSHAVGDRLRRRVSISTAADSAPTCAFAAIASGVSRLSVKAVMTRPQSACRIQRGLLRWCLAAWLQDPIARNRRRCRRRRAAVPLQARARLSNSDRGLRWRQVTSRRFRRSGRREQLRRGQCAVPSRDGHDDDVGGDLGAARNFEGFSQRPNFVAGVDDQR